MANTVRILRSTTAGNSPSSLVSGQIAVNEADGRLFYRSAAGAVTTFSSIASFATTGSFPAVGLANVLYLASDSSRAFQFIGGIYVEVGVSGGGIATTSASDLTSGTLADARLSATVTSALTDSRTPTSHASSHASGGADAITPSSIGAANLTDARLTKTLARFIARDNYPPATNFATLDTRNSVLVLEFDAATEESATFIGVIPENASLASGLTVRLWWMGDTATSGNVRWGVQFEDTGTDLDADSYDTNAQVTSAASATSGIESVASIAITTIDSLAAGDRFRLRVYRVAADATNDTMTGDAQLVAVEVRAA